MQIVSNSRQIPKEKDYLSNSKYCDYLYGYLQAMSSWDGVIGHPRYVYKKAVNYSRIAQDLDRSRQTISKKFKEMLEGDFDNGIMPLIKISQDGTKYELVYLQGNLAMLVPESTLQVLVSTLKENAISIYVYLLNRYIANGDRGFRFTYSQLKNVIGAGVKSHGNNSTITAILFVLRKIGLLQVLDKTVNLENGLVQTQHYITWMTNQIEDLPDNVEDETDDKVKQKNQKRWDLYTKMTGKVKKIC